MTMKIIALLLLSLLISSPALTQELPVNFEYKRETGQDTGVPVFILLPRDEAMTYDAMRGSSFEAVGMLAQPERDKYGIIFINAKDEYQLAKEKAKGVVIKIDGEDFKIADYSITYQKIIGQLKIEGAAIIIDKGLFDRMITANDIFIHVGSVAYSLDEDNINALRYYGEQVKKDIARRTEHKGKARQN